MSKPKMNQEVEHREDEQWDKLWVTQKVALWRSLDNTFLLVKGTDPRFEERYPEYEQWGFLGGHIDIGEKIEDNLKREVEEEAGKIEYEMIGPVFVSRLGDIKITYLAEYKSGEVTLSPEHSELRWETAVEIEKGEKYHPLLKEAIKKATERLKERALLDDLKRLQADFDNYKKRQQESQKELGGYLIEKLVLDIVPVLDNFRAATMHVPPEQKDSPWVTGIQYIEKQLETVLVDNGVTPIDAEPGTPFDPSLHEAVGTEAGSEETEGSESIEETGHKIAKVLQKGYKVGSKVVRPARVSVS